MNPASATRGRRGRLAQAALLATAAALCVAADPAFAQEEGPQPPAAPTPQQQADPPPVEPPVGDPPSPAETPAPVEPTPGEGAMPPESAPVPEPEAVPIRGDAPPPPDPAPVEPSATLPADALRAGPDRSPVTAPEPDEERSGLAEDSVANAPREGASGSPRTAQRREALEESCDREGDACRELARAIEELRRSLARACRIYRPFCDEDFEGEPDELTREFVHEVRLVCREEPDACRFFARLYRQAAESAVPLARCLATRSAACVRRVCGRFGHLASECVRELCAEEGIDCSLSSGASFSPASFQSRPARAAVERGQPPRATGRLAATGFAPIPSVVLGLLLLIAGGWLAAAARSRRGT